MGYGRSSWFNFLQSHETWQISNWSATLPFPNPSRLSPFVTSSLEKKRNHLIPPGFTGASAAPCQHKHHAPEFWNPMLEKPCGFRGAKLYIWIETHMAGPKFDWKKQRSFPASNDQEGYYDKIVKSDQPCPSCPLAITRAALEKGPFVIANRCNAHHLPTNDC